MNTPRKGLLFLYLPDTRHCFIDGSGGEDDTIGAAVVLKHTTCKFRFSNWVSTLQTELVAVYIALSIAHDISETNIVVHIDSLSALLKTENTKDNMYITTLLPQEAVTLRRRGKTITPYWVPSHVNLESNERAYYEPSLDCSLQSVTFHVTHSLSEIKARARQECLRARKDSKPSR